MIPRNPEPLIQQRVPGFHFPKRPTFGQLFFWTHYFHYRASCFVLLRVQSKSAIYGIIGLEITTVKFADNDSTKPGSHCFSTGSGFSFSLVTSFSGLIMVPCPASAVFCFQRGSADTNGSIEINDAFVDFTCFLRPPAGNRNAAAIPSARQSRQPAQSMPPGKYPHWAGRRSYRRCWRRSAHPGAPRRRSADR